MNEEKECYSHERFELNRDRQELASAMTELERKLQLLKRPDGDRLEKVLALNIMARQNGVPLWYSSKHG